MEMLNTKPELVNRRQRLVSQFVKRTRVKKKDTKKMSPTSILYWLKSRW